MCRAFVALLVAAHVAAEEASPLVERWLLDLAADAETARRAFDELAVRGKSVEAILRRGRETAPATGRARIDELVERLARDGGQPILFEGEGGIWHTDAGGDRRARTSAPVASVRGIAWAPDGKRFGVASLAGDRYQIVVATLDDKHTVIDAERSDENPLVLSLEWSPNGRFLACASEYREIGTESVRVIDLHTNSARRITPADGRDIEVAWSPDSGSLALVAVTASRMEERGDVLEEDHEAAIEIYDLAGARRRRVFAPAPDVHALSWSPDGRQLAWASVKGVVLGTADGKRQQRIYAADIDAPGEPLWSPDGSRLLVHQAALPPGATDPIGDLRTRFALFDAEGKELARWMAGGRAETVAWSPDGKRIAWTDGSRVVVTDAGGKNERVVSEKADGYSLSWR